MPVVWLADIEQRHYSQPNISLSSLEPRRGARYVPGPRRLAAHGYEAALMCFAHRQAQDIQVHYDEEGTDRHTSSQSYTPAVAPHPPLGLSVGATVRLSRGRVGGWPTKKDE
jgi:hypothetical protein